MLLKRIYKIPEGWERQVNEKGDCINMPPLDYVALGNTGTNPEQNFPTQEVIHNMQHGLMGIDGDTLIFNVHPEPLRYAIKRRPGRYCLHCGTKLPDDAKGELARLHVAEQHAGVPSPHADIPAGYENLTYFECVLDAEQHEKYRVRPERKHLVQKFYLRGE